MAMEPPTLPSTDDESFDHGVDEYVSDCNRLPFAGPLDATTIRCAFVGCALLLFAVCGGVYGVYRLMTLIIH